MTAAARPRADAAVGRRVVLVAGAFWNKNIYVADTPFSVLFFRNFDLLILVTPSRIFTRRTPKMDEGSEISDSNKTKKNELFSEADKKKIEGSGSAIPNPLKHVLETSLGQDLSGIKVHSDANAHKLTSLLGAEAFSHGNDIVFGAGKYDPASPSGQKLIEHELNHVVQQNVGWINNGNK